MKIYFHKGEKNNLTSRPPSLGNVSSSSPSHMPLSFFCNLKTKFKSSTSNASYITCWFVGRWWWKGTKIHKYIHNKAEKKICIAIIILVSAASHEAIQFSLLHLISGSFALSQLLNSSVLSFLKW